MRKFSAKYNLKGKTSIVIGGLGLIGWSITESLIYSGSKVFIIDKDEKDNEKEDFSKGPLSILMNSVTKNTQILISLRLNPVHKNISNSLVISF